MTTPRLELKAISKRYGALLANDAIDLTLHAGEIHAVLGENGAGKSTLMKIIYGALQPDGGQIFWHGEKVTMSNPANARALGIAMVFQHFSLFESLTVLENIALGLPPMPHKALLARLTSLMREYDLQLEPQRHVLTLSVGQRQQVEIARALMTQPKVLILDEPTSVLTPQAIEKLFAALRRLAQNGCSILYISHKLDEIRNLCERCTVIRGGKNAGVCDPRAQSAADLARLMLGADMATAHSAPPLQSVQPAQVQQVQQVQQRRPELLSVRQLSLPPSQPFAVELKDIQFSAYGGEILGIAGVSGNGQQELLAVLSGESPAPQPQQIMLCGEPAGQLDPAKRRTLGLAYLPENRLGHGAAPDLSLAHNVLLTNQSAQTLRFGFLRQARLRQSAAQIIRRFQVKAQSVNAPARSLSGGNLQKYLIGREMLRAPQVFLAAQPTWGVDVGAQAAIHAELLALKQSGSAIIIVSEDLDELLSLSDRLIVIAGGRMSPPLLKNQLPPQAMLETIGRWMSGLWQEDNSAREVRYA